MAKIIWSDDSIEDLRQIVSFIATDNPDAAVRVGKRILNFTRLFETNPKLGRMYVEDVRVAIVDLYLIYYTFDEGRELVTIEHVWHGAREQPDFQAC